MIVAVPRNIHARKHPRAAKRPFVFPSGVLPASVRLVNRPVLRPTFPDVARQGCVDEYTWEYLTVKVDRSITRGDVIDTVAELFAMRGVPVVQLH